MTMSKIKNLSRGGWIVVGFLAALLLIPSGVAVAAALRYTGIEGNNGITATVNKAGVSSAHQVLASPGDPSTYFSDDASVGSTVGSYVNPLVIASSQDEVVTQVTVNVETLASSATYVAGDLYSGTGSCSGPIITFFDFLDQAPAVGIQTYTFPTGLAIPTGDELCIDALSGGTEYAFGTANGYGLPTGTVAGPERGIRTPARVHNGLLVP
jgi:hypothetical protein